MDFFEAQRHARGRTNLLLVLFGLSVLGIIGGVYFVVTGFLAAVNYQGQISEERLLAYVAAATGGLILLSSAVKTYQLQGGSSVARLLGGRQISPNTTDPDERQLLNVVEEMSIASGTPVPDVFVLPYETGINAFAAGWTMHDATIGVTRGALERLDRPELQGVIAHEFSHILNGDMRLNLRMVGLIYGMLQIAVLGRGLLPLGTSAGRYRQRRGGGLILGVLLLMVGYAGVLCGKIIKSAISRQREFLADAAAVQFTRNPAGLASALKKIGGLPFGSRILDHHAEEVSHLFIADGVGVGFGGMLATHPPLEKRIRRLDPTFDGRMPLLPLRPSRRVKGLTPGIRPSPVLSGAARSMEVLSSPAGAVLVGTAVALESVGAPTKVHLEHAGRLLEQLPDALLDAARDPRSAPALVLALLVDATDDAVAHKQRGLVRAGFGEETLKRLDKSTAEIASQPAHARLPLLELALPALRCLEPEQARVFMRTAGDLVRADGNVHIFEYALMHILARQLGQRNPPAGGAAGSVYSFQPLRSQLQVILSALAWAGNTTQDAAMAAFQAAADRLPRSAQPLQFQARDGADLPAVDQALTGMEAAAPGVKRRFLEACVSCVAHDGVLQSGEAELVRAIAECLDSPVPPLVQSAVTGD